MGQDDATGNVTVIGLVLSLIFLISAAFVAGRIDLRSTPITDRDERKWESLYAAMPDADDGDRTTSDGGL